MTRYQIKTPNISTTTFTVQMIDGLLKKYYHFDQWPNWSGFGAVGLWIANYRPETYQEQGGPIENYSAEKSKIGYGGTFGGGLSYLVSPRFFLNGLIAWNFPLPLMLDFHKNCANQHAISFRLSISYRLIKTTAKCMTGIY
jgi:hypothetical protein